MATRSAYLIYCTIIGLGIRLNYLGIIHEFRLGLYFGLDLDG